MTRVLQGWGKNHHRLCKASLGRLYLGCWWGRVILLCVCYIQGDIKPALFQHCHGCCSDLLH